VVETHQCSTSSGARPDAFAPSNRGVQIETYEVTAGSMASSARNAPPFMVGVMVRATIGDAAPNPMGRIANAVAEVIVSRSAAIGAEIWICRKSPRSFWRSYVVRQLRMIPSYDDL
jgi:uncharacterized membrane protein YcfT